MIEFETDKYFGLLICRSMWDALLKTVRCEIISFIRNNDIDAYVLRWVFITKKVFLLYLEMIENNILNKFSENQFSKIEMEKSFDRNLYFFKSF